jgi:acetate kinase
MNILVINCGSSSLNYKIYTLGPAGYLEVACHGKAHRVGIQGSEPAFIEHHLGLESIRKETAIPDHRTAANLVLDFIDTHCLEINAIGHRFVHGGSTFQGSVILDRAVRQQLQELLALAPIHNPNSLSVIDVCQQRLPGVAQYLTFDTAFHASLPEWSYRYALPVEVSRKFNLRKYGFHGLSYQFISTQMATYLGKPLEELKLIVCHLGTGGSSIAAISKGQSLDTSMGYSPLAGLMMSTRTGDLDPLLPVYMLANLGYSSQALDNLFNKKSGLLGVSGISSDMHDVLAASQEGDDRATLAVEMYTYRLRKMIGAYTCLLGGADALVFTDAIGAQIPHVRALACQGLQWCGIAMDAVANATAPTGQVAEIGAADSRTRIFSAPTDEELVIAQEGLKLLKEVGYAGL